MTARAFIKLDEIDAELDKMGINIEGLSTNLPEILQFYIKL